MLRNLLEAKKIRKLKKLTEIQAERLKTARDLLLEPTTTLDKIQKVAELARGFSPKTDKHLEAIIKISGKLQKVKSGDVINLSLEEMPEKTEKRKKRKKMLVLLLAHWRNLGSEVERISGLTAKAGAAGSTKAVETAKIAATAKGPLGVITIAAAGIVAVTSFLNSRAVTVAIKNEGCRPIRPISEKMIDLPGLKLPKTTIESGGEGAAVIPGINLTVTMNGNQATLEALGLTRDYGLPLEIKEIIYDGQSLLGRATELRLGDKKNHEVIVRCR